MKEVYLDNSATTIVCDKAAQKVMELLTIKYGNPSSLHSKGLEAENELTLARQKIADMLGTEKNNIIFTSGGTEANNLAILGSAKAHSRKGKHIITTSIEHSSVMESMEQLEKIGFEVEYLKPDAQGCISPEQILNAIRPDTILVSMMYVNNELGSILPVESIKRYLKIKKSNALIHIDAVQAFGKIPVKVSKLKADLITITAHKVHGPKGVGALYIGKDIRILPRAFGGEQEKKLRPGTQASSLIAGFGCAVDELCDMEDKYELIKTLRDKCLSKLSEMPLVKINSGENALPYIINFSVEGIRSETMLHYLASRGIYVSSGSACAKGKKSHVLISAGLPDRRISSAIRVSFSRYNTEDDIDELIKGIQEGIKTLVKS